MKISSEQEMIELGARFASEGFRSAAARGEAREPRGDGSERRGPRKQSGRQATVIELIGDVGAGKTTFVRGLARSLGVEEPITSPSYTISKSYSGKDKILVHYDFYRLSDPGIMRDDLLENLANENTLIVIEWSDSIKDILPQNHTIVKIKYNDDNTREVEFL